MSPYGAGRSRGGNQLSQDALGRFIADTDNDGVKEIVDGFGQPLQFYRFAFGTSPLATGLPDPTPYANGIQGLNPAPPGSKTSRLADPLDPGGRLLSWAISGSGYAQVFGTVAHPIATPASTAYYVIPVLMSAGPDGQLGFQLPRVTLFNAAPPPNGTGGMNPPDPTNAAFEADNIYSFNLKGNP